MERKPSTIVNADVVGYNRLAGEDEEWTYQLLLAA